MDTLVPWNGEGKLLKLLQLGQDNLSCFPLHIIVLRAQEKKNKKKNCSLSKLTSFYFSFIGFFLFFVFFLTQLFSLMIMIMTITAI